VTIRDLYLPRLTKKLMHNSRKAYHHLKDTFVPGLSPAIIAIVVTTLLLSACGNNQQQNSPGAPQGVQSYKVMSMQPRSVTLSTDYPASIQGQQNIEIRPKVDGFVEKIYVDEGSLVKKGQLLFKINNPQYEQDARTAEAGIKTAEADVNTATLQVNKVKPLVEKDIISHYELESAQLALQTKQAALAQARAALENARINVGYTTIVSPVDGVIGSLPYKLGSLVNSTTTEPLTTVYNTANVYVYFAMNEKDLLAFSRDSTHSNFTTLLKNIPPVTLLLSDGSTYDNKGKVETVNGLINTSTGSANFRAGFPNPRGLLRSGSSATVRIPRRMTNVLVIPQNVTYQLQDKRFVYLIDAHNKIKNAAVTVMDNTPGQFFIVTGGLKPGDRIIAEGAINLQDGTEIKPAMVDTASVYKDLN
jgi:membrane fusion protein (multidrug efflux system)